MTTTRAARRSEIEQFLEVMTEPGEPLDVAALARRFGMSRATLYRLFEHGLVRRARARQLERARARLASPACRHLRIIDVAAEHGFGTESGFIRAFRRRFGVTPAALRGGRC